MIDGADRYNVGMGRNGYDLDRANRRLLYGEDLMRPL